MPISSSLLWIVRFLPRGGFHVVRLAAVLFEELRSYPIHLDLRPGIRIKADLRESVWYPLWRYSHYPHQLGEDLLSLSLLKEGHTVWDIGANIGYTTLIFAGAVGIEGRVIAFEPSVKAFRHLQRTVGEYKNIQPINLALSDFIGTIRFADASSLDLSKVLIPSDNGGYEVICTTLDQWMASYGGPPPNFIKIDVEGHEAAVIKGANMVISEYCPTILFEALDRQSGVTIVKSLTKFSSGKYFFYRIRKNGTLESIDNPTSNNSTNNYLAICKTNRDFVENKLRG